MSNLIPPLGISRINDTCTTDTMNLGSTYTCTCHIYTQSFMDVFIHSKMLLWCCSHLASGEGERKERRKKREERRKKREERREKRDERREKKEERNVHYLPRHYSHHVSSI